MSRRAIRTSSRKKRRSSSDIRTGRKRTSGEGLRVAEARVVTGIVLSADGQCFVCAGRLLLQLQKEFPNIDWEKLAQEQEWDHTFKNFKKEFGE